MKNQKKIRGIAVGAVVAALYVVLTYLANTLGLASGAIQVRLSEILTVMPVFTPFAILSCLSSIAYSIGVQTV